MGIRVKISGSELRKNRLVRKEDWYKFKLDGITQQSSKKAHVGTFYIFEFLGLEGEAADIRVPYLLFTSRREWPDNLINVIECLTGQVVDREAFTGDDGPEFELLSLTEDGQNILEGFVTRGQDQDGNPANEISRIRRVQE